MMKRYLLSIILGFLAMSNISYGQLEINFSGQTANTNGTVDIDVTTNGFTDISVLQFSAGWDSLVMTFNSVTFTNPALPDLAPNNISGPMGASNVDSGQFSFSYGSPTGDGNLNDGDIIFTVRFNVVGNECDETNIELTNDPTNIEAYDANFNELSVSSQPGAIMINGSDCGGGGGDDLTVTAATVNADAGSNICVPLTVTNFIGVQAGSGTILWDPAVISYTGLSNINLGGLAGSLNETNVSNGELKFVWSNPDPANPFTLADGEVIFEICFDAIGPVGNMSPITLSTQGNLGFEWTDDDDEVISQSLVNGKVTITQPLEDPVIFNVSDATVNIDQATNVCVDISVENFNNILSTQYVITWDAAILSNATPSNFNLPGLNASSFNIDGNCATLSWSGINGIDVADNTQIYSMCFDIIGPCDSSSPVDLVSKGSTNIEIVDGNTDVVSDVLVNAGTVSLICGGEPGECNVVSIDKTCVGELGGNITMEVTFENCTYSWANSAGMEVSTDKNLLGVAAGTYIFTATCDGEEACTQSVVIENHDELILMDDITNAGCGDLGAISVNVTSGSGNYSYNWNPAQADSPNISNLDPGAYQLTVTDNINNCTKTASYNVVNEVAALEIANSVIVDETCIQGDGRISLTVDGGCEPYMYEWSLPSIGNTPNALNLPDGTYMVTVTDDAVPANSVTGSFTVDGSDPIVLNGMPVITPSSGSDGSISIVVSGGNPDYDYSWSGPTSGLPNNNTITGLAPGSYEVTVTDSNGCQKMFGPYVVNDSEATIPEIEDVIAENNANGFSVICNGDGTGVISGTIKAGVVPMTIELSGDASQSMTAEAPGVFSFIDLPAGTYTITVSNSLGEAIEDNIVLSEPDAIVTNVSSGCDSEGQCDGFIDLNGSGGFGDLSYDWGDANLVGGSIDDLCQGSYAAIITDENGCEFMQSVVIESCEGPIDPDCYEVRDVITPNGDGMNDQFAVTCISDFPASLEVYDRWGKLVFNQDSYDGTWMGVSNSNEDLNEGGYMYIINIDFGQGRREIMKGTITLLRD